jgi:hypothetical protein
MKLDHKRLGALALAQCGAFAAVLLLAPFSGSGHSPTPPVPSPTPVKSSPPVPSSPPPPLDVTFTVTASPALSRPTTPAPTSTKPTKGAGSPPTPTGTPTASTGFQNSQVVTLDPGTLKPVASGRLNSADVAAETVPENHNYLVCLQLPKGWKSAGADTYRLPGWICAVQYVGYVGTAAANMNFELQPGTRDTR